MNLVNKFQQKIVKCKTRHSIVSSDIILDIDLTFTCYFSLQDLLHIFGAIIINAVVLPVIIVVIPVILIVAWYARRVYLQVARYIVRMEAQSKC